MQSVAAEWLQTQPDTIYCSVLNCTMTLRACQKRLASPLHYQQDIDRNLFDSGSVVNSQYLSCATSGCPHYVPTGRRFAPGATKFGILGGKNTQERLCEKKTQYDSNADIRAFHSQGRGIRKPRKSEDRDPQKKTKLQKDYEARQAARKARRLEQDRERVNKMALHDKLARQGKSQREIALILDVSKSTLQRWVAEGPGRAGIFKEKERIRREERRENG